MNVDLDLYAISGDFRFLCAGLGLDSESATIDYLENSAHPTLYGDDLPYLDAWIAHALHTSERTVGWSAPQRMHGNIKRRFDDLMDEIGKRRGRLLIRSTGTYAMVGMSFSIVVAENCNTEMRNSLAARSKQMITII